MKRSVYIETSILSALVDERDHPISQAQRLMTEDWWVHQRRNFDLFSSEAVLAELEQAEFPGQEKAVACLQDLALLAVTPEVEGVAAIYQQNLLMPRGDMGDAMHLAFACVYELDYLLTWNCGHLANTNKVAHILAINRRLGLLTPTLLTPEMLVGEETENGTEIG
jgi:predicted nucleic acid-binding protein